MAFVFPILPSRGMDMKQGITGLLCFITIVVGAFCLSFQSALAQTDMGSAVASPIEHVISRAEKLRRLDIMLMVTGLRCRTTPDDFREDFEAFEAAHLAELNDAVRDLKQEIVLREGKAGVERSLDKLGVTMANQFGGGHPWLDCHALKQLAHELALTPGVGVLADAADLAFSETPRLADAH